MSHAESGLGLQSLAAYGQRHYYLECTRCHKRFADDGYLLACDNHSSDSFLRTVYEQEKTGRMTYASSATSYNEWLPVGDIDRESSVRPGVFQDTKLGEYMGLDDLWVAFSGYWPDHDAAMPTGTFKDLEATTVLGRMPPDGRMLLVPSAGNTSASFAHACTVENRPVVLVIPGFGVRSLSWLPAIGDCVRVVVLDGANYSDAMALADRLAHYPQLQIEGGARNVARRDGVGTTLHRANAAMGSLPDYYFQAVGSGAGPIATYEAALRIIASSPDRRALPRIVVGQNIPYTPIVDAWLSQSHLLKPYDNDEYRERTSGTCTKALSNRTPAYGMPGGLFDVLRNSNGDAVAVSNDEILSACHIYESLHDIDIEPEGGAALASLLKYAKSKHIDRRSRILLNITGGGRRKYLHREAPADCAGGRFIHIPSSDLSLPHIVDHVIGRIL
jgi:cysteate synthase